MINERIWEENGYYRVQKKKKKGEVQLFALFWDLSLVPVPHLSEDQVDEEDAAELCSGKDGFCI